MNTNEILKALRQKEGITQAEAAEKFCVSLSSYQKYERDKNSVMPSLDVLMKFADHYKVTIDYLLGREPAPDPFAEMRLDPNDEKAVIDKYMSFPEQTRAILLDVLRQLAGEVDAEQEITEETTVGAELDRRAVSDAEAEETAV